MTDEEMAEEYVLNLQKEGFNCFLGKGKKYKDKIFEIYFPSEFNNNFVLTRSIF